MFLAVSLYRPLIVISGAGESEQESMGTFQEYHQVIM